MLRCLMAIAVLCVCSSEVYSDEVTKTVVGEFSGSLNNPSNIVTDVTVVTNNCSQFSTHADCIMHKDGKTVKVFSAQAGVTSDFNIQGLALQQGAVGVTFDSSERTIQLTDPLTGKTFKAYFRILGVGYQVNAINTGTKISQLYSYPDGSPWQDPIPSFASGGDCSNVEFYAHSANGAYRAFWWSNKVGTARCFATNAVYSGNDNTYRAFDAFFMYSIRTDDVRAIAPGAYVSNTPLTYTIGSGKDLDLFPGRDTLQSVNGKPMPTALNINASIKVTHDIKITGTKNKIRLYPGKSISWDKWKVNRTPLHNQLAFNLASTGPVRISYICKDGVTPDGDCAMRRRLPSGSAEVGAIDANDINLYGVELSISLSGFRNHSTDGDIQKYKLKPSSTLATNTTEPTSYISVYPTIFSLMPGIIEFKTAPGVAEKMTAGYTYAGSITFVFEPGEI